MQILTAYSEGRANANDVMRALRSHRSWLAPALLVAPGAGAVDNLTLFVRRRYCRPVELWIFTDRRP